MMEKVIVDGEGSDWLLCGYDSEDYPLYRHRNLSMRKEEIFRLWGVWGPSSFRPAIQSEISGVC
jgi:hypothetical protein